MAGDCGHYGEHKEQHDDNGAAPWHHHLARHGGHQTGTIRLIRVAGTRKLSRAGMKSSKNCWNGTLPACHTIRVVMSPKG